MATKISKNTQNPRWQVEDTSYVGRVLFDDEYFDLFDCEHFAVRASERINSDHSRIEAAMMYCTAFEALMENEIFSAIIKKYARYLSRLQMRWHTTRFQIRDRINHVSFVFEARPDLREVFLITVIIDPDSEKEVRVKRGCICFDIAPAYSAYDGTSVTVITVLDWRDLKNCRGVPIAKAEVNADDFSWR